MNSQTVSNVEARPNRWQFGLRKLFIWMLLIGVLLPAFGTPVLFDLICFYVFAKLAIRFRQRRQVAPWWTLLVAPLVLICASTPFILLDDQLKNGWMVAEVWWCTAVLSIAFGICLSLIVQEWSLPRQFYAFRFGIAAVLLFAGIGLSTWMPRLPSLGVFSSHIAIKRSSPHEAGGAHFDVHLPGRLSSPEMNYIRQGRSFYWSGARIDLAGCGLFYLRSKKSGGDYISGPFLIVVIPYWVMILGGGAGVFNYSSLRSKVTGIRFSPATCVVMLTAALVFIWANVRPSTTDEPVLHDFGFPLRYLRVAIQHGEQLEYYMGYSLGWQLDQMMLNVLLAGVLILTAGVAIESITKSAVSILRPDR